MKSVTGAVALLLVFVFCDSDAVVVERIFPTARVTRGNTNIVRIQPIDAASWIWDDQKNIDPDWAMKFLKFRNEFTVEKDGSELEFDVSADERFYLTLDGGFIARGPNRAVVENWQYQTYRVKLPAGKHVMEAVVWKIGNAAPLAQLSFRGGFILKAKGDFDGKLTTGKSPWQVGRIEGIRDIGYGNRAWGVGSQFEITGCGPYSGIPKTWKKAVVVRGPAGREGVDIYGSRTVGWMLFPSAIPDQISRRCVPGRVKAVSRSATFRSEHVYTAAEAAETLDLKKPFTVPAKTRMQLAWDLGDYYTAYPHVVLSGGKGAKFAMCFAEASHRGDNRLKTGEDDARGKIVGRFLPSFGDTFISDGRKDAEFSAPWFRCGKWVRIDIETADEPLEVSSVSIIESRYPLEMESVFTSPDDATLAGIRRIAARAMQMCCHEMLFDCPYFEQQMYPGDTRVQLKVISAMTRDDRIIKRAIELYDLSSRDDGMCPFNWPTRGFQEGASYTLCYLLMYGDYAMDHADRRWLKARVPGMRRTASGLEYYENEDALLENLPGWNFMDWVSGWPKGVAPGGHHGAGVNSLLNLFWVMAMQSVAKTERALGNALQAKYWEEKIERLKPVIIEKFWCPKRGLLADTPAKNSFCEHSQCLALLADVLPADKAEKAWKGLLEDKNLKRCTVYFQYYLFETYFKYARGDLFMKRLDLWRDYVRKGLATTQEAPDEGDKGQYESRSDCHAWGSHPIHFMQAGLAGIRPDAPFFEKVRIAPCPGTLGSLKAKHPHHGGWIEVDLSFKDGEATGTVKTPVGGIFEYGSKRVKLVPGTNAIR